MDIDQTLKELRELVAASHNSSLADWTDEIVERFEALDEWLSNGGFFPLAWSWNAKNNNGEVVR